MHGEASLTQARQLPQVRWIGAYYPAFKLSPALTAEAASANAALDLRVLQSPPFGEWAEPFREKQVGSSAMPFKRNPIEAEKLNSLARYLAQLPRVAWDNTALSLLERTLDDSANRRIVLPEAFLTAEELLRSATTLVRGLRVNEHAIARTLAQQSRIIILDEPNSALTEAESERLFELIRRLRASGVTIVYVSPRMEEVFALSDRITVLRDGHLVGVIEHDDIVPDKVVNMMIGKELSDATASRNLSVSSARTVLEVKNLSSLGKYENVSFEVKAGEVVVLTGLVGSGRTEVLRSIFSADRYDSGEILFEGRKLPRNTAKVIGKGFGLIPEDRRTQGFVPLLSVERNVASTNYDTLSKHGVVLRRKERELGQRAVKILALIHISEPTRPY